MTYSPQQPVPQPQTGTKNFWIIMLITVLVVGAASAYFVIHPPELGGKNTVVFEPAISNASAVSQTDLEEDARILGERWLDLGYHVSFTVTDEMTIIGKLPAKVDAETINQTKRTGLVEFVDFGQTSIPVGSTVNTDFGTGSVSSTSETTYHTIMTNSSMQSISVEVNQSGGYQIAFTLTDEGKQILSDFTSQNTGNYLGIVLDKSVISCPVINSPITNGKGIISGSFTQAAALNLAAILKTQPLPVPLK